MRFFSGEVRALGDVTVYDRHFICLAGAVHAASTGAQMRHGLSYDFVAGSVLIMIDF